MNEQSLNGIHPSLQELAFPVDKLELLPGNPRRGNVQAVINSYEEFGQLKAIVGRMLPDGEHAVITAGNTQLQAARKLGWSHIAVVLVDHDDDKAAAFAIADNRIHDMGEYDDEAYVEMLNQIRHDDDLLKAAGFDLIEIAEMEDRLDGLVDGMIDDDFKIPDFGDELKQPEERPTPRPVISATIVFSNEEQQQSWHSFVRWLRLQHPDLDTLGERLDAHISGLDMG